MHKEFIQRRRRQWLEDLATALVLGAALIAVVYWKSCR